MKYALGGKSVDIESWADLVAACAQGVFDENEHCELKRGLAPSSQNPELARDLASLTVLGGIFLVGVKDAGDGKAGEVLGVGDPSSVATRLVQIANGLVEPSVVCSTTVIADPAQPELGCVLVAVPPSATAPHRADERYWGRTSHGKRVLSDPEVAALFESRRHRVDQTSELLQERVSANDLLDGQAPGTGHLHFVARPAQTVPRDDVPWAETHPLRLMLAAGFEHSGFGGFDLTAMRDSQPHPHGVLALARFEPGTPKPERWVGRLLIRDDGGVDLSVGGVVAPGDSEPYQHLRFVYVPMLAVILDETVRLCAYLGQELGYSGAWQLGMLVTGLRGAQSASAQSHFSYRDYPALTQEQIEQVATASTQELGSDSRLVVNRLVGPLARGLGESKRFPYAKLSDLFTRYP